METYFNIRYELDRNSVIDTIERQVAYTRPNYICVVDDNILNIAMSQPEYLNVINSGLFSICDSDFIPRYIKMLHGRSRQRYQASYLMMDIVGSRKYKMLFLGEDRHSLESLRDELSYVDARINNMQFLEIPSDRIENLNYRKMAEIINRIDADIIWVGMDSPDQEAFMYNLKPYLSRGLMIGVGATVFEEVGGSAENDAPDWMISSHIDFAYHMLKTPRRALSRCSSIAAFLPRLMKMNQQKRAYDRQMAAQLAAIPAK